MGVEMGDAVVGGTVDGFVIPPVSRVSSYDALCGILARWPASTVLTVRRARGA